MGRTGLPAPAPTPSQASRFAARGPGSTSPGSAARQDLDMVRRLAAAHGHELVVDALLSAVPLLAPYENPTPVRVPQLNALFHDALLQPAISSRMRTPT